MSIRVVVLSCFILSILKSQAFGAEPGSIFVEPLEGPYLIKYDPITGKEIDRSNRLTKTRYHISDVKFDTRNKSTLSVTIKSEGDPKRLSTTIMIACSSNQEAKIVKSLLENPRMLSLFAKDIWYGDRVYSYDLIVTRGDIDGAVSMKEYAAEVGAEYIRRQQLEKGEYGGNLMQKLFDAQHGVGVFEKVKPKASH